MARCSSRHPSLLGGPEGLGFGVSGLKTWDLYNVQGFSGSGFRVWGLGVLGFRAVRVVAEGSGFGTGPGISLRKVLSRLQLKSLSGFPETPISLN